MKDTFNILIDALLKEGRTKQTQTLIELMSARGLQPNVVTYSSLVDGLCKSGQWEEATKLLSKMINRGMSPDVHMFSILIDPICKEGNVKKADDLFDMMIQKGVEPNINLQCLDIWILFTRPNGRGNKSVASTIVRGCEPNVITYNTFIDLNNVIALEYCFNLHK
ncbi:hypothetical protein GIB67_003486 [Kingdonia uniflora]|uniref:Pentatricopeptide repeat-containing protein n=1 Tax=Kingdonia uniflora TaxID=39325 RepID=A0A7J7MEH2_9MAGN|nr:hypothetical protein GIB67_003486 [Kingdonia uniflora]